MNEKAFSRIRFYITVIVTFSIWLLLSWNYFHGGIPKHHILADETLPEISNIWGAVLLPLLTWFLLYRVNKRVASNATQSSEKSKHFTVAIYGLVGSAIFGILLSVFFTLGYANVTSNMMLGVLLLSLFFPIFRAECILGFVLGMTFTFGAALPIGVGFILALIGALFYLLVRPVIIYLVMVFLKKKPE